MGWWRRRRDVDALQPRQGLDALGASLLALRAADGMAPPPACTVLYLDAAGQARQAGGKVSCRRGEMAWIVHPGPYRCTLTPYAAAPELGLQLDLLIDPALCGARLALLLAAECAPGQRALALADWRALAEQAVRGALAQEALLLPPCATEQEWQAFRAGLDELMFMRLGMLVDDCLPQDCYPGRDLAAELPRPAVPAAAPAAPAVAAAPPPASPPPATAEQDGRALRRLFLELPALAAAWRALPCADSAAFAGQQQFLRGLALAALEVNTMPALAQGAPGRAVPGARQAERAAQTLAAVRALDEAWALLAQRRVQGDGDGERQEAQRILANLSFALAGRRALEPA